MSDLQLYRAVDKHFQGAQTPGADEAARMDRLVEERDKAPELFKNLPVNRQAEINRWAARAGRRTGE